MLIKSVRNIKQVILVFIFSLVVSALANSSDLEIESKIPATISGKLGYASMKYWVEVPGKQAVMLMYDMKDDEILNAMIDKDVTFEGSIVTYSNGSIYFQPKIKSDVQPLAKVEIKQAGDYNFQIYLNGEMLYRHDEFMSVSIAHELAIKDGTAVLLALSTGGTACPMLYQLIVAKDNSLGMISKVFGTCSDEGQLKQSKDSFSFSLPGNPSQLWVWDNNTSTLTQSN